MRSNPLGPGEHGFLQEALLSRRRVFFTETQVYFECRMLQHSGVFDQPFDNNRQHSFVTDDFGNNVAEVFSIKSLPPCTEDHGTAQSISKKRLAIYGELLTDCKSREISLFSDSLNAFSAILAVLSDRLDCEFLFGLLVEDLPYALGWAQEVLGSRHSGFPSWSWSAWSGQLICVALPPPSIYLRMADANSTESVFVPVFRAWHQRIPGKLSLVYDRDIDERHQLPFSRIEGDLNYLKAKDMPRVDFLEPNDSQRA